MTSGYVMLSFKIHKRNWALILTMTIHRPIYPPFQARNRNLGIKSTNIQASGYLAESLDVAIQVVYK